MSSPLETLAILAPSYEIPTLPSCDPSTLSTYAESLHLPRRLLTSRSQYLADWVASMILVQSKLKWRARLLEKFISIAVALRALENFDSLMG